MTTVASPHSSRHSPDGSGLPANSDPSPSRRASIGTLLIRVIVPLWLVAGALFKLSDLNPNVLPQPVKDVVFMMEDWVTMSRGDWLVFNMRAMIAVEIVLFVIMLLVPKLARTAAIAILTLFCVVMAVELLGDMQSAKFKKDGLAALLKPCGCFGAWSPPTIVTFLIDLALLIGCIACPQSARARRTPSASAAMAALVGSLILGPAIAFGRPEKTIEMPQDPTNGNGQGHQTPGQVSPPTNSGTNNGTGETTPPTKGTDTPPPAASQVWPAFPTKLAPNYFIVEKKAVGQTLASLPIAPLLAKSVPADFSVGRKTLIFYRDTCDNCFELMNKHFGGKLTTPTYSIQIPDSAGGKTHSNPCKECVQWELPKGPDYILQAPLVMTIVDGTIAAICKDPDKPGAFEATMNAWAPGHEKATAVDGMFLAPMPAAGTESASSPGAAVAVPASKPFPPMPALETVYAPDPGTWTGKRLDELDLPLIISRPIPLDLNRGDVIVMFYRVDCEHCEAVIIEHFAGTLPAPTLLVAIPDALGQPFNNPCTECLNATLPPGPTYVVETPVLVIARDGVVKHVFSGQESENIDEVRAALPKPAPGK
jgi:hypothetical protein